MSSDLYNSIEKYSVSRFNIEKVLSPYLNQTYKHIDKMSFNLDVDAIINGQVITKNKQ